MSPKTTSPYDARVVKAGSDVQAAIGRDLRAVLGSEAAVVGAAPAGAGKSHFAASIVGDLRKEGARIALVAPTNEQIQSLVERVKLLHPKLPVTFIHASGKGLPPRVAGLPGVSQPTSKDAINQNEPLVLATLDKLADAYARYEPEDWFDVLVVDEAYQADAARYYATAGVAPTHLLIGDSGQLDPFTTIDDPTLWRGGAEDPLQTAVGVLLRNHPTTTVHPLPVTRRLDPRAAEVARSFYPGHHFDSVVLPGVRELRLDRPGPGGRRYASVDKALDESASHGWAHLTLSGAQVLSADPQTAELIVDLVRRLLARNPKRKCENATSFVDLETKDIAIGVSHNDQKDLLRAMFDDAGMKNLVVDTANRLQGLTFEFVIAWHPLAGADVTDAFHLDPGRLCVLLTRHRQACVVVGRDSDRELLEGVPPATPGYLGWDPDPVLDGWDAHESVFAHLAHHLIAA